MRPTLPSLVNILVPVKRSIDYAVYAERHLLRLLGCRWGLLTAALRKIRIASDGKGVDTTVKHSMVSLWPVLGWLETDPAEPLRRDR
jgi:electron transfer flavoprotein beta subunit